MEVTEINSDGLKRGFKIVIPAADIEARMNDRLAELSRTLRMPGFRPGKVPPKLLRKTHGQTVLGEILERTVSSSSQETLADRDLRPVTQPTIEITSFEDGSDLEYTMELELFPEIEPMDFSTLKLERLKIASDETQIDETLAQIADRQKESRPVEAARKCAPGDIVVIDFTGTIDGEEFAGGKAEGYQLELGSGAFIPGFEEQITGASPGDDREVKVSFPDDYPAEELKGKEAVFAVAVKELREAVPVPIDDELAKKLGLKNLEEMKQQLRADHEREHAQLARLRLKRALLDALEEAHDFPSPLGMVEGEFETIWKQFEEEREKNPDAVEEEDRDKSDDELKKEYRTIAERRVRLGLLLAEIGRLNEIEATPEELNRAMMSQVQGYPGHEKEMIDYFRNNPQAMDALRAPVLEDKVVDFILELADVSDREVSLEELTKELEAPITSVKKVKSKSPANQTKAKASSGAKGKKTAATAKGEKSPAKKASAKGKKEDT